MSWVNPVWSDEERQLLRQLWRQRNDPNELKHHFPGRTAKAVKNMASKMGLITWRVRRDETIVHRAVENRAVVPECLWADRDRRANAPRTLTMMLCGDPPFSQSALGRRNGATAS